MKSDYVILALICLAMVIVTVNSLSSENNTVFQGNPTASDDNELTAVTIPVEFELEDITEEEYETSNGMKLTLGKVRNYDDVGKDLLLALTMGEEEVYFDVTIAPRKMLTYAKVDGMLIVPKSEAEIYPENTTYYPTGEILEVSMSGANTVEIYTGRKAMPSIVIADSVHWAYNYSTRILKIQGRENLENILVYWGDYGKPVMFMEDTRKIENLNTKIKELDSQVLHLEVELKGAEEPVEDLKTKLNELENKTNTIIEEKIILGANITEMNQTAADLENRISANTVVSPAVGVIWIFAFIVLVILLIDIFLFGPRRKK